MAWELGKPRNILVDLVNSGRAAPSKTLDLCCGAGTNPIYLAKKGFDVIALDISDKAVEYAKERARKAEVEVGFLVGDFLSLPFSSEQFDFAFDFGCFHHVQVSKRLRFIKGLQAALKPKGMYLMACFSYKNGPAWNHFTRKEIFALFGEYFKIERIRHFSSLESDRITRYFYEVLMEKTKR